MRRGRGGENFNIDFVGLRKDFFFYLIHYVNSLYIKIKKIITLGKFGNYSVKY